MKSLQTEKQFSYKGLLYKLAIFVVTVCVIVYFLPREGRFNYQFDINKPWKYGLLQASFDFPIYKDDAEAGQYHALVQSVLPDGQNGGRPDDSAVQESVHR